MQLVRMLREATAPEIDLFLTKCGFTDDEAEICKLLSRGLSVVQVSCIMSCSTRTVSRRTASMCRKIETLKSIDNTD